MTAYDGYVFFLCLIVFLLFTTVLTVLIVALIRFYLKLVRLGAEDEKIKTEYEKANKQKKKKLERVLEIVGFSVIMLFALVLLVGCVASSVMDSQQTNRVGSTPSLKVVMSGSMSYKEKDNKYLFDNNLNNQIQTFDLIVMHELPPEEELKLYDVVSYEINGDLVLHRIVGIEEPNEKHPHDRWFLLQGDAVHVHDKFPVLYQNRKGIYRGTRIPAIGSFFVFMQSPAGFLSILLILFAFIATPIAERKIKSAKDARYAIITAQPEEVLEEVEIEATTPVLLLKPSQKKDIQAFQSRIASSSLLTKAAYAEISSTFENTQGIRISYSATYQTFKQNKRSVARLMIRNQTVCLALNLDPKQYQHIRESFDDYSRHASFSSFPMVIRLDTMQKIELAKRLISDALIESEK